MDWIKKRLKGRWTRFWLRASMVPFDGAPLAEWHEFAKTAPRWLVEETAEKWFEDVNLSSYWADVCAALRLRLQSFERLSVDEAFLREYKNLICVVPEYFDGEAILKKVQQSEIEYPFLVVDSAGTFKGVALDDNLVVVGVIPTKCQASEERAIQRQNAVRSLSLQDVRVVAKSDELLQAAGIKPFHDSYWYRDGGSEKVWSGALCQQIQAEEAFVISKL